MSSELLVNDPVVDWAKSFAKDKFSSARENLSSLLGTSLEEARLVLRELPGYVDSECIEELLAANLNITTVIRLGGETFGWSVTSDRAVASDWEQKYSQQRYAIALKKLGIDYHWILLVHPQYLFSHRDLMNANIDWAEESGKARCATLKFF